ncbi:MAG: anti-sigma factor [Gemmatimonadota bacterium]
MSEPRLPYYPARPELRSRVETAIRQPPRRSTRRTSFLRMTGLAAALALVASAAWISGARRHGAEIELTAVLDGHLRSLEPGHLADVASTDQHTVKPWFAGKLEYSPPVVDLAAAGFPLVGGRVDVVDGRKLAALVYSRRSHIINLFVRPLDATERSSSSEIVRHGYNIAGWTSNGMRLWAVSDLSLGELREFRDLMTARIVESAGTTRSR